MTRTERLALAPQDIETWSKLFKKHKEEYLRNRLRSIKLSWEGKSQKAIAQQLGCSKSSLHSWIDSYLSGGFPELLSKWTSGREGTGRLNKTHKRILTYIILHKNPMDYSYQTGLWTLEILKDLIKIKWSISLGKSQLYTILTKDLGLSHQKFHRDYREADEGKQKSFIKELDGELVKENQEVMWFDEFSLSTRTDDSYGWAVRNTSPTIPSREKKENAKMFC